MNKTRRKIGVLELSTIFILIVSGLSGFSGCSSLLNYKIARSIPPGPDRQWQPPRKAVTAIDTTRKVPSIPRDLLASKNNWSLEEIIDLALRNNPQTRVTWALSRSAAANLGSRQGDYLPQLSTDAVYSKTRGSAVAGRFDYDQKSYEPSLSLNYLLFDFGQRHADVDAARQALYSANWTHNATIQNVVLEVEQAYYQYLYSKALRLAQDASFKEAQTNLDAAEQRHKAGLATINDVLQARTGFSQAQLALQSVEGQIQTIRGALATAMGLPANTEYDVGLLPDSLPVSEVSDKVEELIAEAQARRPDLAATRAQAIQAEAQARSVKAEGLPSISLASNWGRLYYNSRDNHRDLSNMSISLHYPLFTGFSHEHDVLKAEADAEAAQNRLQIMEQKVVLDIWTSYYELKTAQQRLKTSDDLLRSATESHTVALERYKAGVGSMIELLTVQSALEDARAQNLLARTDWFLSLAQLAHDTGSLWIPEGTSIEQRYEKMKKDGQK